MSDVTTVTLPPAKEEPLFKLDLGTNGGLLAPTNLNELERWIEVELNFWGWTDGNRFGMHLNQPKEALEHLRHAKNHAQNARQFQASDAHRWQQEIEACKSQISQAYGRGKFPHSSTPLAKRVENYCNDVSPQAAVLFLSTQITLLKSQVKHEASDLGTWRGMVEGVIERFQLGSATDKASELAAKQSFEQLRNKAEQLVGEKAVAYEALHRDYLDLADSIRQEASEQITLFAKVQAERQHAFEKLTQEHQQALEALRKTFREGMAMRAPAQYWESKRKGHRLWAGVTGGLSFFGIAAAAGGLGWQIHELLQNIPLGTTPETWRLAMLALIGVFSVWALRLLVRMFLSHLHLLTDAGERVVMVQTYLSLMEGDQLSGKEDRQLILQALFRPASDGIVKDEGVPFSLAEVLTRSGKA